MTADIRTAAQREAELRWPYGEQWSPKEVESARGRFMMGAVWAAIRVLPTREQLVTVFKAHQHDYCEECTYSYGCTCGWGHPAGTLGIREDDPIASISEHHADVFAALMQELAEVDHGG